MVKLMEEIRMWLQEGKQLLIMGDFNDDTTQGAFKRRFQEVGLVDALAFLHDQPTRPTYNCGSYPIDAIYMSPGMLHGATGGYLAFEEGLISDHCGLWLDLQTEVVFGNQVRFSMMSMAW